MLQQIGEVSGEIWNYLNSNGNKPVSLATIAKNTNRKKDEVAYGVGWLAKEGKLNFQEGSTVKVSLAE